MTRSFEIRRPNSLQNDSATRGIDLYSICIRGLIGYVWDMGCEIRHQSKALSMSNKQENSALFNDSFSTVIRLAILAEKSSNIHIQVLFHAIISHRGNMLSIEKIDCINSLCDFIESRPNGVNVIQLLNQNSSILYEERHKFHESLRRVNLYLNMISKRLLFLNSSLLAIMMSLAVVIAVLVVCTLSPSNLFLPSSLSKYIPKSKLFDTIMTIKAIELSSTTIIVQVFIVFFILLTANGSHIMTWFQRKYLATCIREARESMRYGKVSINRSYSRKYTCSNIIFIMLFVGIALILFIARGKILRLSSPRKVRKYDYQV